MADEPIQGVDPAALMQAVRESVKAGISDVQAATTQQVREAQARRAEAEQQSQWAADPVYQTVMPMVGPALQSMDMRTRAAEDKSDFYLGFPDAMEFKGDIESIFNQLMTEGRPQGRESIWYYFKGRNEKLFADRAAEKAQNELRSAAQQHASIGGSDLSRAGSIGLDDKSFMSLDLEGKRKALEGRIL